jgi:hypothetical protein
MTIPAADLRLRGRGVLGSWASLPTLVPSAGRRRRRARSGRSGTRRLRMAGIGTFVIVVLCISRAGKAQNSCQGGRNQQFGHESSMLRMALGNT